LFSQKIKTVIFDLDFFLFTKNEVIKLVKSLISEINKQQPFFDYYYEYIKDKSPKL